MVIINIWMLDFTAIDLDKYEYMHKHICWKYI